MKTTNQRGSLILSALVFAAIMAAMIAFSAVFITDRIKQVNSTAEKIDTRIILDSAMAYTINGVKQSWCFSSSWVQEVSCDLNYPRNVERLLLSDESLAYIAVTSVPHPVPTIDTRIMEISQSINLSSVTSNHPLYLILDPIRKKFSDVSFTIKREASAIQTTKGREVPLRITVSLKAIPSEGLRDVSISSKVYVFAREISYFALLMPKDLNLGIGSTQAGDISLKAVNSGSSPGLRFESPIFINDNLNLPPTGSNMKNVTFADKVYLGGGFIKQSGSLFSPKTAGGPQSSYNNEMPSFPGLLSGYELDAERDEGLDYLFNLQAPLNLNLTDFNRCKARIMASVDLSVTKNAQLYTGVVTAAANTFNLSAHIGSIDNLVEQKHMDPTEGYRFQTSVPGVTTAGNMISRSGGSVFRVKFIFEGMVNPVNTAVRGTYMTEFYMTRNSEAVVFPIGNSSTTSPQISIKTTPHVISGNPQFNQVDFAVEFVNQANLNIGTYLPAGGNIYKTGSVKMVLESMDYGYSYAKNIRDGNDPTVTNAQMGKYKVNGFSFEKDASNNMNVNYNNTAWNTNTMINGDYTNYPVYDALQVPDGVDYIAFDEKCFAIPENQDAFYMSFGAADWTTSYVKKTRASWSFTPAFGSGGSQVKTTTGYLDGDLIIDQGFARFDPATATYPEFKVQSLVKNCVIKSSANFVAGFYTCEHLIIEPRTEPLRIIGTIITADAQIDDSAYGVGIRWSSIFHPSAAMELRMARILGREKNGNLLSCNDPNLAPLWLPNIGIQTVLTHYLCNPISLRNADPFRWTTVDPDCAYDETDQKVKCKKRLTRFLIKEVSRSGDL
ncbi:MAG: hypothetical protein IPM97_11775 [Bdellovibrionaceae bacterium]|nr:hypothetical protein [Pseudobdellovibrionaceae bacterium]